MIQQRRATIDDLYAVEGPAELVGGRIIRDMTGERPSEVGMNIVFNLRPYVKQLGRGKAYGDNLGYVARVEATDRDTFCPDVSYHTRPTAANSMRFVEGAPDFAVEVRSESDYGGQAVEDRLAEKRSDYFTAGTLVVWDVDPVNELVMVYRTNNPTTPTVFKRCQIADAEPAVPGWRMSVDDIFA